MSVRPTAPLLLSAVLAASCSPGKPSTPPPAPVIDSIAPRSGLRTGGEVVTITGQNFRPDPFLTLGINNVVEIVSVTDSEVQFRTPPSAVGPASLTLIRPDGGRVTQLDAYFYKPLEGTWYQTQYFDGAADISTANVVDLVAQATVSDLQLELGRGAGGSASGTVTDPSGAPAPNVSVWAARYDGLVLPVATLSDLDGSFSITSLPPGDWRVYTHAPPRTAWANVEVNNVTVTSGQDASGVTLALLDAGSITGVVTGANGPIAGASVSATMVGNFFYFGSAVTDAAGVFTVDGLAPGDYTVLAFGFAAGHATEYYNDAFTSAAAAPVSVTAGASATADFLLAPGAIIRGTVLETTTLAPLTGQTVVAEEVNFNATLAASTNGQGEFAIQPLPPGEWRVSVGEIGQYYNGIDLSDPGSATLLTLAAGEETVDRNFVGRLGWEPACADVAGTAIVTGVVESDTGNPLTGAVVEVIDDATGIVFVRKGVAGTDGIYTLDCIPPGTYRVRASDFGSFFVRVQAPATITVAAAETVSAMDFALSLGGTLEGRVEDLTTHGPLSGVVIEVFHVATGVSGTAVTAPDGTWKVNRLATGGLPAGGYTIRARNLVEAEFNPFSYY